MVASSRHAFHTRRAPNIVSTIDHARLLAAGCIHFPISSMLTRPVRLWLLCGRPRTSDRGEKTVMHDELACTPLSTRRAIFIAVRLGVLPLKSSSGASQWNMRLSHASPPPLLSALQSLKRHESGRKSVSSSTYSKVHVLPSASVRVRTGASGASIVRARLRTRGGVLC